MRPVTVSSVRNQVDLLDLRDAWNGLLSRASLDSVFLRHEWFDAAWRWLQAAKHPPELMVLCVHDAESLLGICPLMRTRRVVRFVNVRSVELVTIPDTQLADIICSSDDMDDVCTAIVSYLDANRDSWDVLDMSKLRADSVSHIKIIEALKARGFRVRCVHDGTNPYVTLDGSWERYYSRRSRRLKKGNNLVSNKLHKNFASVQIKRFPEDYRSPCLATVLSEIQAISAASWKGTTGLTLDQPGPRAFITTMTELALRNRWLSIFLLYLDGRPVAMEYQLVSGGNVHALRADFRSDCSEYSPGTYLNQHSLKALFVCTHGRYWMGPGRNAYKLRWAEQEQELVKLQAFSDSFRGRLIAAFELGLLPIFRSLRNRFAPLSSKGD
jgi:hypothetical protein